MKILFQKGFNIYFIKLKKYMSNRNEDICSICLENKVDCKLFCNHVFHKNCIKHLSKLNCPYCRTKIVKKNVTDFFSFRIYNYIIHITYIKNFEKIIFEQILKLIIDYHEPIIQMPLKKNRENYLLFKELSKLINNFIKKLLKNYHDNILYLKITKISEFNFIEYEHVIYSNENINLKKINLNNLDCDFYVLFEKSVNNFFEEQLEIFRNGYNLSNFINIFNI